MTSVEDPRTLIRTQGEKKINMTKYFDFEVELLDIEPRIWRRFLATSNGTFESLHDAIQYAFGWERKHLYEFRHFQETVPGIKTPVRRIARCKQAEILDDQIVPFAEDAKLASFFAKKEHRCLYLYDFGDNWQHVVQLKDVIESSERFTRRLVGGAIACPPEDCGGPPGYEQMLERLDMSEEQVSKLDEGERPEVEWLREEYREWTPDAFDLAAGRTEFARHPESGFRNR